MSDTQTVSELVGEAIEELTNPVVPEVTEETPKAEEGTEEVPEDYFGVPMGDLPPETRAAIIEKMTAKDSRITKLEQRIAEQRKAEEDNPEPQALSDQEPAVMPTDEELLGLFGFAPDHPYYEMAREITLPIVKQNLILAGTVEQMKSESQAEQAWNIWNDSLDSLEAEHGTLPMDRDVVFEYASENNIFDPEVAYMKLAFGAKKVLNEEATKARVAEMEALRGKKRAGGTVVRPRGSVDTEAKPLPPMDNIAEAIKIAAGQAEQELGSSWDTAAQTFLNRR